MKRIAAVVAIVVVLAVCVGLAIRGWLPTLNAVASVNGERISRSQFTQTLENDFGSYVLAQTIRKAVIDQKAKELGVSVTDADIDAELTDMKNAYGVQTDEELEAGIVSQYGITLDQFKAELLRYSLLLDKIRTNGITVSNDEAIKYYTDHKDDYFIKSAVDVKHMLLRTEDEAKKARNRVANGESFDSVAMEVSTDPAKSTHGILYTDITDGGNYDPDFTKAALALAPGEISQPVKTAYGYHIIQCVEKRPGRQQDFSEVESSVIDAVKKSKAKTQTETLSEMMNAARIDIKDVPYASDVYSQLGISAK